MEFSNSKKDEKTIVTCYFLHKSCSVLFCVCSNSTLYYLIDCSSSIHMLWFDWEICFHRIVMPAKWFRLTSNLDFNSSYWLWLLIRAVSSLPSTPPIGMRITKYQLIWCIYCVCIEMTLIWIWHLLTAVVSGSTF